MGKMYDSLLAGTSGRTGRVVVANVHGSEISKVRPRGRSRVPSPKQLLIQKRFKLCITFINSYRAYARKHFGTRSGMRSCYNLAMMNLLDHFVIDYAQETITPDYPALAFSHGNLLAPIPTGLTAPTAGTLELEWQNNSMGNAVRGTNLAQIVLAADGEEQSFFIENAAQRSAESYAVALPLNLQAKKLHVWLAFRSDTATEVSNSVYSGSVQVP